MIEEAQVVLHEADEPDLVGKLVDADRLATEGLTEIDSAPADADASAARDDGGAVVKRVVELSGSAIGP